MSGSPVFTKQIKIGTDEHKFINDVQINGIGADVTAEGVVNIHSCNTDASTENGILPFKVNDRYLHTNATTGALEWSEVAGGGDVTKTYVDAEVKKVDDKIDDLVNVAINPMATEIGTKQDKLTAGAGITLTGNVISQSDKITSLATSAVTQHTLDAQGHVATYKQVNVASSTTGTYATTDGVLLGAIANNEAGEYAVAEGLGTKATGTASHAEGNASQARETYAHAEGISTTATGSASHTEGAGTVASGNAAHAEGISTTASQSSSHAEGRETIAFGDGAHAEGFGTKAQAENSHAEGSTTIASGAASHAEGSDTTASGNQAHAEGRNTNATKQAAHAEGEETNAINVDAHAEGKQTEASGIASHAEGEGAVAKGEASHAEGSAANAIGEASHAEGCQTKAKNFASHAEGEGTIASQDYQHVQGKYNVEDTVGDLVDIVGWGTSDTDRKNIAALTTDGALILKDSIAIGANDKSANGYYIPVPTAADVNKVLAVNAAGDDLEWVAGGGGSSDYTTLTNKPKINGVELNGNLVPDDADIPTWPQLDGLYDQVDSINYVDPGTGNYIMKPQISKPVFNDDGTLNTDSIINTRDTDNRLIFRPMLIEVWDNYDNYNNYIVYGPEQTV